MNNLSNSSGLETAQIKFLNVKNALKRQLRDVRQPNSREISNGVFQANIQLRNQILLALPDAELAALLPHLEFVRLKAGEEIWDDGKHARRVYFPETAVISRLHFLANGKTAETALTGNEGAVNLNAAFGSLDYSNNWLQATVGGIALRIETEILASKFAAGGILQKSLLKYLTDYVAQVSQKVVCYTHHLAEERFCCWLLLLVDRAGTAELKLTHDQISQHLGIQRPSITHAAQMLKEKEILEYCRGRIRILDLKSLESLACECYSLLKAKTFQHRFK